MEGSQEKDIHLVYKKLGETPLLCIDRFRKENTDFSMAKITYAGRLDPLAEGLLILLTNEKVNEKERYLDLEKVYEVEILWGFSTDTADLLGKVTNIKSQVPEQKNVEEYLLKSVGDFVQDYPAYSSKPVEGKPLFTWARENRLNEIKIPSHGVSLKEVEYLGRKNVSNVELLTEIREKINLVKGDFRQNEILDKWKEALDENMKYVIDKFIINVSSGFYVRQFVSDMASSFETSGTTFHIKRVKVGDFTIADCIQL